jgi:gas vesicle protein
MTNDPEVIRQEIEETRSNLSYDVDALADKVSPSSIVQRRTERVKGMARKLKDNVMGVAEDAKSHVSDAASTVGDKASHLGDKASGKASRLGDATHNAADKAKGNPVAVGLIAFGVGLLAASLIPASSKERELGQTVKDKAAPLVDDLKETAKGVAQDLKEPAKDAADAVKGAAASAVSNVKDDATSQVKDVKGGSNGSSDENYTTTPSYDTTGYVAPDSGASALGDEPVYDATRTDDTLR